MCIVKLLLRRCGYVYITANLPTNITPTNIAGLELSGKFPMGLGIPPFLINIMLEPDPLKPTMLVGRLGVPVPCPGGANSEAARVPRLRVPGGDSNI